MKRWFLVLFRSLMALAIVFACAGVVQPVDVANAGISNPDALRTGELPPAWRWVETLGQTGQPYPQDIQGNHLNRPAGIYLGADGVLILTEENGKRFWRFDNTDFQNPLVTPTYSGINDPFWNPRDVTRFQSLNWVIDGHHLAVLDNGGNTIQNFHAFDNTDPALGWVQNNFQCANSLSFDPLTDLLYVMQNCGDNPVLALRVESSTPGIFFPQSLTLVDAFRLGGWNKHHIQAADLNDDGLSEVYVSGDNGAVQCEQPASMPGDWNCSQYAPDSVHRGRGIAYQPAEDALYILDQVDWDWAQNGIRKCYYDGTCENVATNLDLQNASVPGLRFGDMQDLAPLPSGDMLVTDGAYSVVGRLTIAGGLAFDPVFGVLNEGYVTADGYFNSPYSVVTDSEDNLYVLENQGRRVLSFDAAGNQRWIWGKPGMWTGDETNEICDPQGNMAIDPAGNLYIADRCSGRVVILEKDTGTFVSSFRANSGPNNAYGFNGPAGVAISSSGRMFVADPDNHRVQEFRYIPYAGWSYFSTIGIPLSWPDPSSADGAIMDPTGLALDGDNEIFIADQSYSRIQKCSRAANTSSTWTCVNLVGIPNIWGNSNQILNRPLGLALDTEGRLYVADNNNQRVQVYDSATGDYLASIGTGDYGSENDRLANPAGVALDSAGNVYVADSQNQRVQKFIPTVPALEYVNQQGGIPITSYRAGDLLLAGYGNRVYLYDLSIDPSQPHKIGQTQPFPGIVKDLAVSGSTAYILMDLGALAVVDISDPTAPLYLRQLPLLGDGQALALDETAANLYVLQNGPTVLSKFSLADPTSPVFDSIHWINGWADDVVVSAGQAYVSVSNGPNRIIALDTANLASSGEPTILDTAQTTKLALDGSTLYAADPGFGLYKLDLNGIEPLVSQSLSPAPRSIRIQGSYAFSVTNNYGEYALYDISGSSILPLGSFTIDQWRMTGENLEAGLDTNGDPLVYLPATSGLSTYRLDATSTPLGSELTAQETPAFSTGWGAVQQVGTTLYVNDLGRLKIFDNTNPSAPVLLNTMTHPLTGFTPFFVRESGAQRILYILTWEDFRLGIQAELRSYDITDPLTPIPLELTPPQLSRSNLNMTVANVGPRLIAAVSEVGYWDETPDPDVWHPGWLEMFDITDPADIAPLPSIETFEGNVNDLAIQGTYLFVTQTNSNSPSPDGLNFHGGGGGFSVYDFSGALDLVSPTPPEFKAHFDLWDPQSIQVLNDTVFAVDRWQGLAALTIDPAQDPANWVWQWIYQVGGANIDLQIAEVNGKTTGWYANDNWMRILDLSNPVPGGVIEVDAYRLPFYPEPQAPTLNLPWLWMNYWGNGYSAWWAAPTLDATVSAPDTMVTSSLDGVSYTFADETLRLWHTPVFQGNLPAAPAGLTGINRAFVVKVFDPQTELPAALNAAYTLSVSYDPDQLGVVDEGSLRLYYWNGSAWVVEPSTLDRTAHTLTAHPDHFSSWSVMGADDADLPVGTISINTGAEYTTSANVDLTLTASDATTSVVSMRFQQDGGAWSAWEDFAATKSLTLSGGQGLRTVAVEFRDEAGNVSAVVSDTITLDSIAPGPNSITVNGGEFVNSTSVTLQAASTGAAWMRFSENSSFTGVGWTAYSAAAQAFTLSAGDGLKTVYAQYSDLAGNVAAAVSDTVTLDTLAPGANAVTIDGGEYTHTAAVTLTPASTGAAWMRFSENTSFTGVDWVAYSPAAQAFTLSIGDGLKTVYAQYRDAAGNASAAVSDTVFLDTHIPSGLIVINAGDAMTNQAVVTLSISSGEDVTQMRFMQSDGPWPGDWSAAQAFANSATFTLTGPDGSKTVYAQFRDRAGNVSTASISDAIVLDTTGPLGLNSVSIEGGAVYTTQANVWLALTPNDALSGVSQMKISNDSAGVGASWVPFSGYLPWTLTGGQGARTVYAWYRDALGNESGPFSDDILLDSAQPNGGITIAAGAAATSSATVNLSLANPGAESGFQMRLHNDVSSLLTAAWEPFTATRAGWNLSSGNGVKSVFAQFKDAAGNLSPIYEDTILVDSVAPTGFLFVNGKATLTNTPAVDLFITFSETGSGVVTMRVANSEAGLSAAADTPYANPIAWSLLAGDGAKTVCVQLTDGAGNVSAAMCDAITLDTTAPVGSLQINGGATETHSRSVTLTLDASDAVSGVGFMMVSNAADFSGAAWQPYSAGLDWTLTEAAGDKTVYVRYMDLAGNATGPIQQSIRFVDTYFTFLPAIRK